MNDIGIDKEIANLLLAGLIWLVVLVCAVGSIFNKPWNGRRRLFWLLTILCVPLVGLLIYIPFSIDNPKAFIEWVKKIFPSFDQDQEK